MIPSLLTLIDLFGRPVTIKFFGKDRFRTQFGGICSLIFFGFLGWVLYNASFDMFSRRNPITINSQIYTENPKPMTLTNNNFPMAVQLEPPVETGYNTFINESIFTVNFVYVSTKRGPDENGEVQQNVEVTRLAKEPCTLSHFGEMADSFSKLDLSTTYCIAKEQPEIQELTIQGSFTSPDDQFIVIRVDLCNNDTSEVECATEEVQKQYLNGGWVYVYFTDMGVDPNNFTHPNVRFRTTYETMVSLSTYKEGYVELSPVYVQTDAGWIMAEEKTEIYTQVYNKYEYLQIEPNPDGILLRCYVALSQTELHYSRTYKKIQNVLAEVGGLANVAIAILMVITTPYLNLKFRESLINELFDIHPITTNKKRSNKRKKNRQAKSIGNTITQEMNQDKITTVGGNGPHEYFKTDFIDTSPNKKEHDQRYELQKVKEDINFDSQPQQTEKDLFCLSPKSPEFQVNSFVSNPDEKDLLSHRNIQIERNQKHTDIERNIQLGDNILHEIKSDRKETEHSNKEAEGHISIKIKAEKNELEMDCIQHKTGMTKVKSKKDISDNMSAIFGDDNFSDCPSEINKQELEFPLPSEQKEELEKAKQHYRVRVFSDHDNALQKAGDLFEKTNIPLPLSQNFQKDPYKLSISPFEYVSSFVYQTESLKQKMQILDEGTKRLNNRLDAVTILKKMREIDKLKAMLFDMDQALLFNNLPKPELVPKSLAKNDENNSNASPYGLLRKFTLREQNPPTSIIRDMHNKLESKVRKSEIDQRFIAVFKEKV